MGRFLRLSAAAAIAALTAASLATAAVARTASPFDAGSVSLAGTGTHLSTPAFGLGEVDLALLGVAPLELLGVGPSATPLSAGDDNMLIVGNPLTCPNAEFPTIQSAVTAAMPGAKIKVCPGLYVEQVTIPTGKNGLTLFSEGHLQAIIQAPPVMLEPKAIVHVNGAQDVRITHFTIRGPGAGGCDSIRWGVRVDNGGSALIDHNHITEIRDLGFSGCQNGIGVLIGRNAEGQQGDATVVHNLIDRYQKGAVVLDGLLLGASVSTAEIAFNEIVGIGETPTIAQNGIQVSRGAVGDVHHNRISLNDYGPEDTVSEGVILFDAGATTTVHHNYSFLNDDGVGIHSTDEVVVAHNRAERNDWDGIYAGSTSAENTISYNRMSENAEHDCHDDSVGPYGPGLVANVWINNHGLTQNRLGLCKKATLVP
jgi:parallel beta-helix repeat protein